jgi:hypothetical protein
MGLVLELIDLAPLTTRRWLIPSEENHEEMGGPGLFSFSMTSAVGSPHPVLLLLASLLRYLLSKDAHGLDA